jgi:hypothetical protein
MRYVLTVHGVPVGHLYVAGGARTCGYLLAYPAYVETGLAAVARRFAEAIMLSHGPGARPSPRQRRLRRAAHAEQRLWQARLGVLDPDMRHATTGLIRVVCFAGQLPMVVIDFRALPSPIGARASRQVADAHAEDRPAA